MSTEIKSRRDFLRITALDANGRTETRSDSKWEVKLGVASYSLREFSRADAIKMMQELRTPYINIKSFHLPYENTPEELAAGRREFEQAGLQILGGGNNNIKDAIHNHSPEDKYFPARTWMLASDFASLQKMKYAGYVNLECAIDKDNPLPGMKQSFAYMRGVLAGLAR